MQYAIVLMEMGIIILYIIMLFIIGKANKLRVSPTIIGEIKLVPTFLSKQFRQESRSFMNIFCYLCRIKLHFSLTPHLIRFY